MSRRNRWDELRQDRLASPAASAGSQRARRAFELGEQLRALREAQHLSQAELARRMGSTQPAIARLEAGRVAPSLDTLDRAAAASASSSSSRSSNHRDATAASCQAEHPAGRTSNAVQQARCQPENAHRPPDVLVLRQAPAQGRQADRRPRRLHLQ